MLKKRKNQKVINIIKKNRNYRNVIYFCEKKKYDLDKYIIFPHHTVLVLKLMRLQ